MSIRQTEGEIIHKEDLGTAGVHLIVHTPGEGPLPLPGQFAMLRPASQGTGVYLGRPISYLDTSDLGDGTQRHEFYIKAYGPGSAELAGLPVGAHLDLMSGLGKGFPFLDEAVAMVAGGVGIAPLFHLATERERRGISRDGDTLYYGGRSQQDLPFAGPLSRMFRLVRLTTEDGSFGCHKGYVTQALAQDLGESKERGEQLFSTIMTCGPTPMMRVVSEIAAEHGISCLVSLETRMACGYGVCLGCAVHVEGEGYIRACVEGPVLEAEKLNFSERWL
jgi:dihydroorotate dehydrogenase electron transfer subunit